MFLSRLCPSCLLPVDNESYCLSSDIEIPSHLLTSEHIFPQREESFFFEQNPDRGIQPGKLTYNAEAIIRILSKPKNAFGHDDIDFPCAAIPDHPLKLFLMIRRCDTFVHINSCEVPARRVIDPLGIKLLRQFMRCYLHWIIRRHTAVDADTFYNVFIIWRSFFCC